MSDNLRHWSALSKTDPSHTKRFQRAGGFSGTAIKPIWSTKMMTEHFGPVGIGWGVNEPQFQTVPVGDEILVYCTVSLWYADEAGKTSLLVYGVGGDKVAIKRKDGRVEADDEAFKKAFTDAVTNAMKFIGVGADVHMGLFDDSKYVAAVAEEYRAEMASPGIAQERPVEATKPAPQPRPAPVPTPAARPVSGEKRSLVASVSEKKTAKGAIFEIRMADGEWGATFNPDMADYASAAKKNGEEIAYSVSIVKKGQCENRYITIPITQPPSDDDLAGMDELAGMP